MVTGQYRADYEYMHQIERVVDDDHYYSLIMVAMKMADDNNKAKLRMLWPNVWDELLARYRAPAGLLDGETIYDNGLTFIMKNGRLEQVYDSGPKDVSEDEDESADGDEMTRNEGRD